MAIDPFAPLKFGIRIGIGVVRFELRVVERVLGLEPEPEAVVVVAEPEPDLAGESEAVPFAVVVPEPEDLEPEPEVIDIEPEPELIDIEPEPEPIDIEPEPVAPEPEPEPLQAVPEPPASEAAAAMAELDPDSSHIDTEPELVAEFAEEGAEDGAGAELRVDEPWEGYRRMRVADVRDRVLTASSEELAVIQLYEITHRRRRTVLDAVERRSRQLADTPTRS
jgi:hypothetical protein